MERKIRILIADNSSAFSIECQKELGLQGFDVVAIDKDGKKVIDILDKQNFDVIMIDDIANCYKKCFVLFLECFVIFVLSFVE